jgi:hypothetical protein
MCKIHCECWILRSEQQNISRLMCTSQVKINMKGHKKVLRFEVCDNRTTERSVRLYTRILWCGIHYHTVPTACKHVDIVTLLSVRHTLMRVKTPYGSLSVCRVLHSGFQLASLGVTVPIGTCMFLRAIKIHSTPSFRWEVKLAVPCHKSLQHVKDLLKSHGDG